MEKQTRSALLTIDASASQLANHPTVGLFYIRDHIRQSTPVMLRCKTDLDNSNTEIQLGTYDADTDLGSVNEMKIVASATFKRLEDLLDGALEDVRELHAIASREAKARSASSSSLKRLLGRR
eukprot:jgi/Botrbrau1/13241/Bobra.0199s0012.6